MPAALALSRIAERTLGKMLGSTDKARRLALSLFFRAALGIERIFHFETLDDLGFAVLSGGKRVLSRSRLGGLVRAVTTPAVKKFARATEQLSALRGKVVTLSLDEHAIARFTRKFRIPKGFHTLRNKICAWIAALAWDALRELGVCLPSAFHFAHPRTLRRWLLVRDADLIMTPSHRIVVLDFDRRRPWFRPLLQRFNEAEVALPWLGGRRVVMGFAARSQRLSDARPVLPNQAEVGSGFVEGCGGVWC